MRTILTAVVCLLTIPAFAHAQSFNLKAGEVVISIDGKPVSGAVPTPIIKGNCANGQCAVRPPTPHQVRKAGRRAAREIRRDARAYAWCLREAQLCAANGYRNGHPRGSCPGSTCTGTGYSHSESSPNHCCSEKGEARCIARACFRCHRTNRVYWCAAYR